MNHGVPVTPRFNNDEERAEVGTIYKQIGKEEAKDRGLAKTYSYVNGESNRS